MGLFDRIKKKAKADTSVQADAVSDNSISPIIQFYNDCIEDYHKKAMENGKAKHGVIFIPELLPIGEKTVLAFLKDPFFQMQYGSNPQTYYYVIMSLSLQAGMVFAVKWHRNFSGLTESFVDEIIEDGPADKCKPYLQEIGLDNIEKENAFYRLIFERWLKNHEPYWKLKDPREYTFRATLAAYQLGISMILCEYGY